MPRLARLDAPGVLHHIIIRGIERCKIFRDDRDRENLLGRLGRILLETKTARYAWTFLGNHAHFLMRTGEVPLATFMRRLATGYVVSFNRRHKRHGHLSQNRYKSIVCQEDTYLQELVRYIHLNPLRAGVVPHLVALSSYLYCGHSALMGRANRPWEDIDYVLHSFGKRVRNARREYLAYVEGGIEQGRRRGPVGGDWFAALAAGRKRRI